MSKLKSAMIFVAGVLVGGIPAAVITKRKCEQRAEEEIQSVKEMFKRKIERDKAMQEVEAEEVKHVEEETEEEKVIEQTEEPEQTEEAEHLELEYVYNNMVKRYEPKPINCPAWDEAVAKEEAEKAKARELLSRIQYEPEVIDADEFGTLEDYDMVTLTYFADGVVADDLDEIIDDYEKLIGTEFIQIFNDFDATSVYVRNDEWQIDYEIIRDDWCFSDIQDCPLSTEEIGEVNREAVEKKPHQL